MNPSPHWTKRASARLRSAVRYIAINFYPEYAVAFANDVTDTAAMLPANPRIGVEAFPGMRRIQHRKILCKNRSWWIYYRIMKDRIEILSVKHALQNVLSPRDL